MDSTRFFQCKKGPNEELLGAQTYRGDPRILVFELKAQAIEVSLLGRKKILYLTDDPPFSKDPKYANWRVRVHKLEVFYGIVWSLKCQ